MSNSARRSRRHGPLGPLGCWAWCRLICGGLWATGAAAWALAVGNRVVANQPLNVRQTPAGTPAGTRTPGDHGSVIAGPHTAALEGGAPLVWWQVNWDAGVDGWSVESGLSLAAPPALVYGVDVSHYQGNIDWMQVFAAGRRFAIAKATEGTSFKDDRFISNMTNGKAAGLIMGAYHFARPLSNPAVTEARHFVAVTAPYLTQGALWPVLDLEDGGTLGKTALSAWVRSWCAEVERLTSWTSIIYCSRSYAQNYIESDLAMRPLWIAVPGLAAGSDPGNIGPWPRWTLEQYSWTGAVPGISGNVDLDVFNGDAAMLNSFLLRPRPSYSTWAATNGLTGADALEAADPDLDGEPNLREYAFGSSPRSGSSQPALTVTSPPGPGGASPSLALVFPRWPGRPDLTYSVQRSSDLTTWSEVVSAANDLPFSGPGVQQSGGPPAAVTVSLVPATEGPTFMRVDVVRN